MSILKDWYDGTIYPAEDIVPQDAAYRAIGHQFCTERERLEQRLSPDDRAQLSKLDDLQFELSRMQEYAHFSYGFRLGAKLMHELCTQTEGRKRNI